MFDRKLVNINKHIIVVLIILDSLKLVHFYFINKFNNIPFTINYSMQKEIDMIFICNKNNKCLRKATHEDKFPNYNCSLRIYMQR